MAAPRRFIPSQPSPPPPVQASPTSSHPADTHTASGQQPFRRTPPGDSGPNVGPMLEGKALLDKARSLSNRPEDQIARACGYVGPSGRLLKKSFYRALVLAKGYTLPSSLVTGTGQSKGRQAEFRTRVHGNGNLLIGQAYTRRMGLEPGQEFRIEIHPDTGSIWLLPSEADQSGPSS
jgi:AbrB-like transcriptional regulator